MPSPTRCAFSQFVGEEDVEEEGVFGDCLEIRSWAVGGGKLGLMQPEEACWAFMTGGGGVEVPMLDRGVTSGLGLRGVICLGSACRGLSGPFGSSGKVI